MFAVSIVVGATAKKSKDKNKYGVYMAGVSASFTDSLVYFTDIQFLDSAQMDGKGFLVGRSQYSVQLKDYLETKEGGKNRTCFMFFNLKKNKLQKELQKLKEILDPLEDGDLVTFKSINVCGYSSPDGSVRTNDRVAKQRAESFALNLKGGYNFPQEVLHVTSAGEDWETLVKMLEEDQPAYAEKALAVIQKYESLDVREARLKSTLGMTTYRTMMNRYYPRLRRLSVSVDYEVREVLNSEAARLIYTNPKLLSLQEMYRVAAMYQPGTKEYKEVYEIAANTYPEDVTANLNAASANIISGDFKKAASYMDKVKDDSRAFNNLGVLAWLSGDTEAAKEWFQKAASVEPEKANANLEKMVPYENAVQK